MQTLHADYLHLKDGGFSGEAHFTLEKVAEAVAVLSAIF